MIEAYAFLAMFTVQILLMSVLHPARLIKYCRAKLAEIPAERYPQWMRVSFATCRQSAF